MLKKIIHFIKYNNVALLILLAIFAIGSGAWAQTDAGQEFIGEKQEKIKGIDNILLLEADLESFDMDFKIEKITRDDKYYFVAYTYLDLVKKDDAWEYLLNEKVRKVSLKIKKDLGAYLAEELKEEYDARVKILKRQQEEALEKGEETRTAVAGYSGLIGKTLKLSEKIFFGYESVKVNEVPSPTIPATVLAKRETKENTSKTSAEKPDDLTKIYFDYLEKLENNIESVDETVSDEEIFDIEEPVADILVDEDVIKNGDVVEEDLTETEDELIEFIEDDELLLEEKETLTPAEEIDADVVGIVEVIELPAEDGE